MLGTGNNMFQGIEQTEDSLYSSKENDESDVEPGKLMPMINLLSLSPQIWILDNPQLALEVF